MEDQTVGEGTPRQVMACGSWGHMLIVAESLLMMLPASHRFLEGGGVSQALMVSCWLGCQFIPGTSGVRKLISEEFLFFPQNWAAFCCFVGVQETLFLVHLLLGWATRHSAAVLFFQTWSQNQFGFSFHCSFLIVSCTTYRVHSHSQSGGGKISGGEKMGGKTPFYLNWNSYPVFLFAKYSSLNQATGNLDIRSYIQVSLLFLVYLCFVMKADSMNLKQSLIQDWGPKLYPLPKGHTCPIGCFGMAFKLRMAFHFLGLKKKCKYSICGQ